MSNLKSSTVETCDTASGCNAVQLIIKPHTKDLGGFSVRRLLPHAKQRMVGPWIFFDHMGPAEFTPGSGINVRPHPHINLATVTYLFDGEILHRDSLGSKQIIRPGDINLMVAGKGIVHSERERPEIHQSHHSTHALQLWLALPADQEEIEPAFYHYPLQSIPVSTPNGINVKVMMGSAYGVTSPVKTFAETLYAEASLESSQSLTLPQATERAIYVISGAVEIGNTMANQHNMAVLSNHDTITLKATKNNTKIAIIGGENLGKRYIEWNFVSTRQERIEQAKSDWQAGNFPQVPDDAKEIIPLPNK